MTWAGKTVSAEPLSSDLTLAQSGLDQSLKRITVIIIIRCHGQVE